MQINLNGVKYNFRNHTNTIITMRTSLTRLIIGTTTHCTGYLYIIVYSLLPAEELYNDD